MANFKQLNRDVNNVIASLLSNQNFCKLIHFPNDNPLAEADIQDTSQLLMNNIFPLPKTPDVQDEKTSIVNVYFNRFRLGANKGTKEWLLVFDVIVHNDKWILKDSELTRPFMIMNEIDEMINSKRLVGIKELQFNTADLMRHNETFSGYSVAYKAVSAN